MQISVVIPTCNRKTRLLSLLQNLDQSTCSFKEIIIVDSGEETLSASDYVSFKNLPVQYLQSEKSVCIQRNIGIQKATAPWIFLCDDDIEVPPGYIAKLVSHIQKHRSAGAVSGIVLQKENNAWVGKYPVTSSRALIWNYIFKLSIWGEIQCSNNSYPIRRIKNYYKEKGNHISKAGWPVITDFTGSYTISPIYGLGASIVRKEWLMASPYDEVLDRHGIGDNYGVAVGFPQPGIHIVNDAFVYHHQEPVNRLKSSLQFYRRTLALDYFVKIKPTLQYIRKRSILWALTGNFLGFFIKGDRVMMKAAFRSFVKILRNKNPYLKGGQSNRKVVEPML
jgi:glycosyltransferase involved in cell wall biosynthesis